MRTKPKRQAAKPSKRAVSKPVNTKPAKSQAAPTRESLLAEIAARLDAVDTAWMAQRAGKLPVDSTAWLGTELSRLIEQLDELRDWDGGDGRELIARQLGAKPGEIPSWARPGTFLLWLDYVPIRCIWGGFAFNASIVAANPDGLWVSPTGYRSFYEAIGDSAVDVRAYFRQTIERFTRDKKFKLVQLEKDAADECRRILQEPESAWLREALARGPVDRIPLPAHLQAVQQHLAL